MSALRPPTNEDAAAAARLMNEHRPEPIDPGDVLDDWTSPRIDLERDARIADDAYVLVERIGDGRVWVEVHGRSLTAALGWAETRASEVGARRVLTGDWSTNGELFDELRRRGYARVRSSNRMEVALDPAPPPPVWPDGIDARTMRSGEERVVYDVHQETFEDTWEPMRRSFEDWSHWHLRPPRYDPALWFLACAGPEVCGIALCHPHRTVQDTGWVGVVGVRRPWRRRGIGRALLLHAFGAFRDRGWVCAGLGVDTAPSGALSLYESAGMRAIARFDMYEKTL